MSLEKYWIVSFFYESGVLELKKVLKLLDFAVKSKLFLVCAVQSDVVCSSTSSDAGLDYMHLFLESFWVV
jgi:hypothetical protein